MSKSKVKKQQRNKRMMVNSAKRKARSLEIKSTNAVNEFMKDLNKQVKDLRDLFTNFDLYFQTEVPEVYQEAIKALPEYKSSLVYIDKLKAQYVKILELKDNVKTMADCKKIEALLQIVTMDHVSLVEQVSALDQKLNEIVDKTGVSAPDASSLEEGDFKSEDESPKVDWPTAAAAVMSQPEVATVFDTPDLAAYAQDMLNDEASSSQEVQASEVVISSVAPVEDSSPATPGHGEGLLGRYMVPDPTVGYPEDGTATSDK